MSVRKFSSKIIFVLSIVSPIASFIYTIVMSPNYHHIFNLVVFCFSVIPFCYLYVKDIHSDYDKILSDKDRVLSDKDIKINELLQQVAQYKIEKDESSITDEASKIIIGHIKGVCEHRLNAHKLFFLSHALKNFHIMKKYDTYSESIDKYDAIFRWLEQNNWIKNYVFSKIIENNEKKFVFSAAPGDKLLICADYLDNLFTEMRSGNIPAEDCKILLLHAIEDLSVLKSYES